MKAELYFSETQLLVVDYFPEYSTPMRESVPEATGARYIGKKWAAQVPRKHYDAIVDRLISLGFDVAPERA